MTATGLRRLIERFCSGGDISVKAANAIEAAPDDEFPEDEQVQDVVLCLASYRSRCRDRRMVVSSGMRLAQQQAEKKGALQEMDEL